MFDARTSFVGSLHLVSVCFLDFWSNFFKPVIGNSKSEYVRCLRLARENILYVATNNGYLYHVQLRHSGDAIWTEVAHVSEEAPIICMDFISIKSPVNAEDILAVGDGKGNVVVISVFTGDGIPKSAVSCTWTAEKERQLLGVYWCKSLGRR